MSRGWWTAILSGVGAVILAVIMFIWQSGLDSEVLRTLQRDIQSHGVEIDTLGDNQAVLQTILTQVQTVQKNVTDETDQFDTTLDQLRVDVARLEAQVANIESQNMQCGVK